MKIKFRYCPEGSVRPGRPESTASTSEPVVDLREFYMAETETTVAQFVQVAGDDAIHPMQERAKLLINMLPDLDRDLQSNSDIPAFFVDVADIVRYCDALGRVANKERQQGLPTPIELKTFRLPTRAEWQYAARGIQSLNEQTEAPHFFRWVQLADLSLGNQEKCREVWKSLGQPGEFKGTQDDFLNLTLASSAADQRKVHEILDECIPKALGLPNLSAAGLLNRQPVGHSQVNAWGLHDVHSNVTEWTFFVTDRDQALKQWKELTLMVTAGQELAEVPNLYLCGGGFTDSVPRGGGLARMTLWGGAGLQNGTIVPVPGNEKSVMEYMPGFRVLMQRTIADDWLYVLRANSLQGRVPKPGAEDFVEESRRLALELGGANHPAQKIIHFYSILINGSFGPELTESLSQMNPAGTQTVASLEKPDKPLSALDRLKQKAAQRKDSTEVSADEQAYFRILADISK